MPTQAKVESVEALRAYWSGARAAVLTEYRGLTVRQLSELRRQLRGAGGQYRVVKNRLARIAVRGSPLESLQEHFRGPTGVAVARRDPVALARALAGFARTTPGLEIKAGVVDGQVLDAAALRAVADLPPAEVLRAQLLGTLQGPLARLVALLTAPLRELTFLLEQRGRGAEPPAGS